MKQTPAHILTKPFLRPGDSPKATPFDDAVCVHDILHRRAAVQPDAEAIVAGADGEERITYSELAARSRSLAQKLRALGVGPGERVGIAIERCVDMVVGVWAVIEAGGAYVPIDPHYPKERIEVMLEDASLRWLLTQSHLVPTMPNHGAEMLCIDAQETWHHSTDAPTQREVTSDDLIYAMYTSGSTGRPKSATIHHKGIVNLIQDMAHRPGLTADDTCAAVISLSHDMSVADIFLALSVGARLVLINTEDAADPRALAAHLARERVSYISATPTTFRMLLALDWKPVVPMTILMAGEALPKEIVGPLLSRGCRIWNGYGMTEASVYSTMTQLTEPDSPITIGGRVANTPIYILNDDLQPVSIGEVGELYAGGVGVGKGYLDRPTLTAHKFVPDPFDDTPGATMYRSGDLARWLPNGDIECLGRKDHQVKIRGFRVELEEIEARLNVDGGVTQAVVIAWDAAPGDKRLAAYITTAEGSHHTTLIATLRQRLAEQLPEYMQPSQYIILDEIPLTPAGKLDRKALPTPARVRPIDAPAYTAPPTPQEAPTLHALCDAFANLLQLQPIGIDDHFFHFGGHSLLAAQLIANIRDQFGVELPIASVFTHPTPQAMASHIDAQTNRATSLPLEPVPRDQPLPTSALQQSQWFIAQLDEQQPEYHVNLIFSCEGNCNRQAMTQAINQLVERHEILRTTYRWSKANEAGGGMLHQCIHPHSPIALDTHDITSHSADVHRTHFQTFFRRPFDLQNGPVWRAQLIALPADEATGPRHALLLCVHHIAIDGWSIEVIFEELCALYANAAMPESHPPPPTLTLQYADYASWQRQRLSPESQRASISFWQRYLDDAPARIALPGALPKGTNETRSTDGTSYPISLTAAETSRLRELGQTNETTLFMGLMASFASWLHAETGQVDLPIGTVFANRNHTSLAPLIGFIANTVVLRHRVHGRESFQQILASVRRDTLNAFHHEDLPFDQVVSALQPQRSKDQQALFNACFILQAPPTETVALPGMSMRITEVDNGAAPFDMTLQLWETNEGKELTGNFLCRNDLIPPSQLPGLAKRYLQHLRSLLADPTLPISHIRDEELQQRERMALAAPAVSDAHILMRSTSEGIQEPIAYVVSQANQSARHVSVSHIPIRGDGTVDVEQLMALPVLDPQTLATLQTEQPDASLQPWYPETIQAHHIDDLLPAAWRSSSSEQSASTKDNSLPDVATDAPLAILEGPRLTIPGDAPLHLLEALAQAAKNYPEHGITTHNVDGTSQHCTYPGLLEAAERVASGLQQAGIPKGTPLLIQCDNNMDFFYAVWGCIYGGYVAVPLGVPASYERESGASNKLFNAWTLLERPPILCTENTRKGIARLAADRSIDLATDKTTPPAMTLFEIGMLHDNRATFAKVERAADDLVLMMLTSGSTGMPKAVKQYHRTLLKQMAGYQTWHMLDERDVFLNWLPTDHVGGLIMGHFDAIACGGRQHHYATSLFSAKPTSWLDWIQDTKATYIWAPNFAFGLIAQDQRLKTEQWDLSSIRIAMNAGEAIVPATARAFVAALAPHGFAPTGMVPAWGMSELCSAVTSDLTFTLDNTANSDIYTNVGKPIPGFSLKIVDPQGHTLRYGEIGRLLVKGASVTDGYHKREELNAQVFDDDGWFDTGDLGFVDERGMSITGRSKDEIIINGINYPSHEIEAAIEQLAQVDTSFTAACAIRMPYDDTDQLAIFYVPSSPEKELNRETLQAIRRQCATQIGVTPNLLLPVTREDIPKTDIGKIQRSRLKQRLQEDLAQHGALATLRKRVDLCLQNHNAVPAWFFQRQWQPRQLPRQSNTQPKRAWIFCHDNGPTHDVYKALVEQGIECTKLTPGPEFAVVAERCIQLRPGDDADMRRTLESIGEAPDWILWMWTYPTPSKCTEAIEQMGVLGILSALKARAKHVARPTQWLIVTKEAQRKNGNGGDVQLAPLMGLLASIPHEHPHELVRHVDLHAELPTPAVVESFLGEYTDRHRYIPEVILTQNERFVVTLEQQTFASSTQGDTGLLRLARGGMVMIVGGLGGLGPAIASWLQQHTAAAVLLVGRTPETKLSADKKRALSTLQANALGDITYASCDAATATEEEFESLIAQYESLWNTQLCGIFHLAVTLEEEMLSRLSAVQWAATIAPKAQGASRLGACLRKRKASVYVDFSSVNGILGGYGAGAYASAVRIGDALAHQLRGDGVAAYHLIWSQWDDVGMSKGRAGATLAAQKGYTPVPLAQGLTSTFACLARQPDTYIIGLNAQNPNIRKLMSPPWHPKGKPPPCATACLGVSHPQMTTLLDRFGVQIPLIADRTNQTNKDKTTAAPSAKTPEILPRDQYEQRIAGIWKEALGIAQVSIDHNFFDLGGHSLLLTQVQQQLEATFSQEIPILTLFRHTTIRSLAAHLGKTQEPTKTETQERPQRAQARGDKQRRQLAQTRKAMRKRRKKDG